MCTDKLTVSVSGSLTEASLSEEPILGLDDGPDPWKRIESDSLGIILSVEERQLDGYTLTDVANDTGLSETTVSRYLNPDATERMPESRLESYRERLVNADQSLPSVEVVVGTYYEHLLASATPVRASGGEVVYEVGTSRFEWLRSIGARHEFVVTYNPTIDGVVVHREDWDDRYWDIRHRTGGWGE